MTRLIGFVCVHRELGMNTLLSHSSGSSFCRKAASRNLKVEKVYCCCFGSEDNSNNLPPLSKTGPRRRLTEHGEGRKKGCQAEFRAVTLCRTSMILTRLRFGKPMLATYHVLKVQLESIGASLTLRPLHFMFVVLHVHCCTNS
jgi:hypothetical protein